jgi:hypothetical protein
MSWIVKGKGNDDATTDAQVKRKNGPGDGRPLVDTITASRIANMKELRPPSSGKTEIRILLVFTPWRSAGPAAGAAHPGSD